MSNSSWKLNNGFPNNSQTPEKALLKIFSNMIIFKVPINHIFENIRSRTFFLLTLMWRTSRYIKGKKKRNGSFDKVKEISKKLVTQGNLFLLLCVLFAHRDLILVLEPTLFPGFKYLKKKQGCDDTAILNWIYSFKNNIICIIFS